MIFGTRGNANGPLNTLLLTAEAPRLLKLICGKGGPTNDAILFFSCSFSFLGGFMVLYYPKMAN